MVAQELHVVSASEESSAVDRRGVRFTDEQKELAFVIWSAKCGRNAAETARYLADADQLEFPPVTARTIRNWADDGDWVSRADAELHAQVPHVRFRTQLEVALGQIEAVRLLRQVVDGSPELMTDIPIKTKVKTDDGWVEEVTLVKGFDWNGLKVRVGAATQLAGMAGLSPIGSRDVGEVMAPPSLLENARAAIAEATPDELADIEAQVMQRIRESRTNQKR